MKIRLWCVFYLQSFLFLFVLLVLVLFSLFSYFADARSLREILISNAIVLVVFLLLFPLNFSKYLTIENGVLSYTEFHTFTRYSRGLPFRVTYSVEAFTEITLRQSPIERLFNVGRLQVRGLTGYQTKKNYNYDFINDRKAHRIYGIPHFKTFRKELSKHIALREHLE